MEQQTGSKLWKRYVNAVYCHPVYLTSMQSTSYWMLSWIKHKLGSRLQGEKLITSDMQMIPPLWQKVKRTKESLNEGERGEWKSWLKTQLEKTKIMAFGSITSWQIDGETMETVTNFFSWTPKSLKMVTAAMKLKDACSLEESYDQPGKHIKKQRHHFANKVLSSQSYGFSSSHVWMWKLDHKASWALKNWCFWTVVLENTLESPLDCKEIKPVSPKGN